MPKQNADLHGNAPDKCPVALLLVDVINDLEFPGNAGILRSAKKMAARLYTLTQSARKAKIPVVYVNDNFGRWRSDFNQQVEHCQHENVAGKALVEKLRPERHDYFVLKPKHSGFYASGLELLLRHLGAHTLIITGIAADRCVLFTANDAYLRDFKVLVPSDCVISNTPQQNKEALNLMKRVLHADTRPSSKIRLQALFK
jgi:nicotinamidase-related amidase